MMFLTGARSLLLLFCVPNIFQVTSSSDNDVDCYIIIIKLPDSIVNILLQPKSPYVRPCEILGAFCSAGLPTQSMTSPQRCFRQGILLFKWRVSAFGSRFPPAFCQKNEPHHIKTKASFFQEVYFYNYVYFDTK
jgi:hypothetical protein